MCLSIFAFGRHRIQENICWNWQKLRKDIILLILHWIQSILEFLFPFVSFWQFVFVICISRCIFNGQKWFIYVLKDDAIVSSFWPRSCAMIAKICKYCVRANNHSLTYCSSRVKMVNIFMLSHGHKQTRHVNYICQKFITNRTTSCYMP